MKIKNHTRKVELNIDENLLEDIASIGIKHYPNEFGGFLIGEYSNNFKNLNITDFILPNSYKGSPYLFERSALGLEEKFENIFKEKGNYYIGEWHTHPSSSTKFSKTDLDAMINIANCETVTIKNPILLILSVSKTTLNHYTFYIYDDKKLTPYE